MTERPSTAHAGTTDELPLWSLMAKARLLVAGIAGTLMLAAAGSLQAQPAPSEPGAEDEGEAQAQPFMIGPFSIDGGVAVTEAYDSNVFATRNRPVGDFVTILVPSITVLTRTEDYGIGASASAEIGRYRDQDSEDYEDYSIGADGFLRIAPTTSVFGGGSYAYDHEPRESPDAVNGREPTIFSSTDIFGGVSHRSEDFRFRAGATYQDLDFRDVDGLLGTINNDDRDRSVAEVGARVGYRVTNRHEVFVQGYVDRRDYREDRDDFGFERSSTGASGAVGFRYHVGQVLDVEALVGLMRREFEDPRFDDLTEVDIGANLSWSPVPSVSIEGFVSRSIEETTLPGASSYVSTGGGLDIEKAIRPDVSVVAGLSFFDDVYQGVDRHDRLVTATLGGRYYVMPNVFLGAEYRYQQRDSSDPNEDYEDNAILFSVGADLNRAYTDEDLAAYEEQSVVDGFYVGMQAGIDGLATELAGLRGRDGTLAADFGDIGWGGGIFAGYGALFDDWYLGFEIALDTADVTWDHARLPGGRTFSVTRNEMISAGPRVGYLLPGGSLIYGRAALLGARFETDYAGRSGEGRNDDGVRTGYGFGIGAEVPISDGFFARLDWGYASFDDYDLGTERADDNFANNSSAVRIGLGYRFGQPWTDPNAVPEFEADFDGAYLGVRVGSSFVATDLTGPREDDSTLDATYADHGVEGGLFAGYDLRFDDLVVGLEGEAEISALNLNLERQLQGRKVALSETWGVGGSLRVGYVLGDAALIYLKGGFIATRFEADYAFRDAAANQTDVLFGTRFGGGLELPIDETVSARLEYVYTSYPGQSVKYGELTDEYDADESEFRIGLLYRF